MLCPHMSMTVPATAFLVCCWFRQIVVKAVRPFLSMFLLDWLSCYLAVLQVCSIGGLNVLSVRVPSTE